MAQQVMTQQDAERLREYQNRMRWTQEAQDSQSNAWKLFAIFAVPLWIISYFLSGGSDLIANRGAWFTFATAVTSIGALATTIGAIGCGISRAITTLPRKPEDV